MSNSLQANGLYSPWNSPGQNTGVGSLSLLQGVFPTQGLNPGLPHCRQILYQLSHRGSPRILEWVAYPFSSRSSWPRNGTGVSCIAGRFFTNWAIREAKVSVVKDLPANAGDARDTGLIPDWEDPLEKEMAISRTHACAHTHTHTHTHSCGPGVKTLPFLSKAHRFVPWSEK